MDRSLYCCLYFLGWTLSVAAMKEKIDDNTFKGKIINICCKHLPVYFEENPKYRSADWDGITKDIGSLIEGLMPTDEEREDMANASFNDEDVLAPICEIDYLGGFDEGVKSLRTRILAAIDVSNGGSGC